jgi:hypothetical protein
VGKRQWQVSPLSLHRPSFGLRRLHRATIRTLEVQQKPSHRSNQTNATRTSPGRRTVGNVGGLEGKAEGDSERLQLEEPKMEKRRPPSIR